MAAVRVELVGDTALLGRLTVPPDRQGNGLGSALLAHAETPLPSEIRAVELFTGERSSANLRLYQRVGYRETHRRPVGDYQLVHLRKQLTAAPR